jgi:hypothetical protein
MLQILAKEKVRRLLKLNNRSLSTQNCIMKGFTMRKKLILLIILIAAFAVLVDLIIKYSINEVYRNLLGPVMVPLASILAVIMLIGICCTVHSMKRK